MEVTKYYSNADGEITHAEISYTVTVGETTATASDLFELRSPLPEYDEAAVIKSVAVRSDQWSSLMRAAQRRAAVTSHTETEV